jgi:hypothetical protein
MDELHENVAGVELALSESVTEKENGPDAVGALVFDTAVVAPDVLLRPTQDGPVNFQV